MTNFSVVHLVQHCPAYENHIQIFFLYVFLTSDGLPARLVSLGSSRLGSRPCEAPSLRGSPGTGGLRGREPSDAAGDEVAS